MVSKTSPFFRKERPKQMDSYAKEKERDGTESGKHIKSGLRVLIPRRSLLSGGKHS
jgi:hypothetical protein